MNRIIDGLMVTLFMVIVIAAITGLWYLDHMRFCY